MRSDVVFFSGADFGVDARLADLSMPAPSARRAEFVLRDTSADGTVFHFVASAGEVDRMGDTINQQGWQLDAFKKKNPVILFAHDSGSMPVGKATSVGVSVEGKLLASVRLAQTQFGKAVSAMVSQGFLRAVSVGFAPLEYDFAKSASRQNGIHFVKPELLEISILPIPANASCLLQSISGDGKSASPSKAKKMRVLALMKIKPAPPVRVRPRSELIANLRAVRAMR